MINRKIKISPEVLNKDLFFTKFSGETVGYYPNLKNILSGGTVNLKNWFVGNTTQVGSINAIGGFNENTNTIIINKLGLDGFNWGFYFESIKIGSSISILNQNNQKFEFIVIGDSDGTSTVYYNIPVSPVTIGGTIQNFTYVSLTISQPGVSQLYDLTIPILLNQDYEDIGYYSPFDGKISQLNEDVNFIFIGNSQNPNQICVYNTSNSDLTYLENATYTVDWGDGSAVEEITNEQIITSVPTSVSPGTPFTFTINLNGGVFQAYFYTTSPAQNGYHAYTDGISHDIIYTQTDNIFGQNYWSLENPPGGFDIISFDTSDPPLGGWVQVINVNQYVDLSYTIMPEQFDSFNTLTTPVAFCHTYQNNIDAEYTINFVVDTNLGQFEISKTVGIPYVNAPIPNPYGTVVYSNLPGQYTFQTEFEQNYIFTGDSENSIIAQISPSYVEVPFVVTGFTYSKLTDLQIYGSNPYQIGIDVTLDDGTQGVVNSITPQFTSYTINQLEYLDFPDGSTIFVCASSGLTSDMLIATGITKMEYLMNVIEEPEIQTYVFIERGKNSAMENFRRIGEVGGVGSLVNYGYKFFDVRFYDNI
jgi:hypothetical protein